MKRVYAPWRHDYVTKTVHGNVSNKTDAKECVFCTQIQANLDDKYFIIKRFKKCFVMMNFYPYSIGHIMVLPYDHHAELNDLDVETRSEMMEVVSIATTVLSRVLKPGGFNVGINLGIAGGGGIPSHLHIHVLPRWRGDTNFLETIGEIKVLSTDFERVFNDLKQGFTAI